MKTPPTLLKPQTLIALSLMCTTPLTVYSQEIITQLETVTSYGAQTALEQRQQSPNSIVVINEDQIERFNDTTAGDVLRRLPGVVFGGMPGENKDVRIRGLDKEYSQVLINGRRIPGGGEKREFQLDKLPAQLIERIEVIRAPTADIDAQGIAGTVNIILKTIPQTPLISATAGLSYLDNGDTKPNFNMVYGGQKNDFGYLLNFNAQQRQLLKDKNKQSFKADGSADKSEQEKGEKLFDEVQFAPSFNWSLSPNDQISLEPLFLVSDEEQTKEKIKSKKDGSIDGKELEQENKRRMNTALYGQWQHQYGSSNEFTVGLNLQKNKEDTEKEKNAYKGIDKLDKIENEIEDKTDQEWALTFDNKRFIGEHHTLVTGIEFIDKERSKNKNKTETKKGKTKEKNEGKNKYNIIEQRFNAFIFDEYTISERQLLTPGIRFEWTDTDISSGTDDNRKSTDSFWSPSLHYVFNWTDTTNIRASFTNTVRRPKFDEMVAYVDSKDGTLDKPDKAGNPDLIPEKSVGFDIGIDHYFAKKAGNVGINMFYRDIEDKIETRVNLNPVSGRYEEIPENFGTAALTGLELDTSFNMKNYGMEGLTLSANVTFLDGDITDQLTGNKTPFKELPDYIYNLGFDHQLTSSGMSWGANYNQISVREGEEIKDGKRTLENQGMQKYLDIYLKKSFANGIELRLSGQNLLAVDKEKFKTIFKGDGSIDKFETELEESNRAINVSLTRSW